MLVNTADKSGREPLHIAAYKSDEKIVKFLMDHGASASKSDSAGNKPGQLASKGGRRKSRELIDGPDFNG